GHVVGDGVPGDVGRGFLGGVAAGDVGLVASAVDKPVLVASGRDDALFPLDGVQHVLDAFRPDVVTAEVFPGGHVMPPHVTAAAVRHLVPA
ncbi:hypothetical protein IAE22_28540, partial [Bacillus sp. S34]|nr:hypothetical protein [Bacillus sp. S34]